MFSTTLQLFVGCQLFQTLCGNCDVTLTFEGRLLSAGSGADNFSADPRVVTTPLGRLGETR